MSTECPKVQSKDVDWVSLITLFEARPEFEVSYQFSNGVTKMEPFNPEGTGIYEEEA